jgi:hypothetical protein
VPILRTLSLGIFPDEGAFSKKVGSKLRFDRGGKKVPTEGEPLKPRFDRDEIAKNQPI